MQQILLQRPCKNKIFYLYPPQTGAWEGEHIFAFIAVYPHSQAGAWEGEYIFAFIAAYPPSQAGAWEGEYIFAFIAVYPHSQAPAWECNLCVNENNQLFAQYLLHYYLL
jgi:hypothetical protein